MHKVRGLQDQPDKDERSNLDHVLQRFRDAGYLIAYRVVSPVHVGIPTSRNRLHFQGVSVEAAGSLAEAKALLADVEMCWDAILQREYAQIPLENFLMDDASQEFTDFCARLEERSECCMKPSRPFAVEAMDQH